MDASSKTRVKRLGDIIEAILNSPDLQRRKRFNDIESAWKFIVGETLAEMSRPVGVKGDALLVEIDSSSVKHELDVLMKEEIVAKLRTFFPSKKINTIRYLHGKMR